ncbi:hypothetical protein [Desulfobacter sp.]|uniref:hypothetical protein n=1 Tax=Desulfobacter sp. TaxID=2294 RepID=UPI003D0C923C
MNTSDIDRIDSALAINILMNTMLTKIMATAAKVIILDIQGGLPWIQPRPIK